MKPEQNKKELLFSLTKNDFEIQFFKGSGPGGQHRNKVETGVRIIHKESGAVGQSVNSRSQYENKIEAFNRLLKNPKMKIWLNRKIQEVTSNISIDQTVNNQLHPNNLKIEIRNENGQWIQWLDNKNSDI